MNGARTAVTNAVASLVEESLGEHAVTQRLLLTRRHSNNGGPEVPNRCLDGPRACSEQMIELREAADVELDLTMC